MQSAGTDDLLTAAELAVRLSVKPETILGWHRRGVIPSHRISRKVIRFSLPDVLAALESRPDAEAGKAVAR